MQCMPALLLKLQNLTEYVDLFSWGIGIFTIMFIQDLPYPDICDISFKKCKKLKKVIFLTKKNMFLLQCKEM